MRTRRPVWRLLEDRPKETSWGRDMRKQGMARKGHSWGSQNPSCFHGVRDPCPLPGWAQRILEAALLYR